MDKYKNRQLLRIAITAGFVAVEELCKSWLLVHVSWLQGEQSDHHHNETTSFDD